MPLAQARPLPQDESVLQFVIFQVGPQFFAVEINRVKEILRHRKVTSLPKAPTFLEGVIDLRGTLIPIIDLRKRFEVPPTYDQQTRIIVLRMKGKRIGLVVDCVQRVVTIPIGDIKAPPVIARIHSGEHILAVAKHEDELYIILDLDRILSANERMSLESVKL
jgi:purine-binding chemotaxis protein CheW